MIHNFRSFCALKVNYKAPAEVIFRPTKTDEGFKTLRDYLLGGDWNSSISSHPVQVNQVNTETILDIMANVPSAKYRRYPWWKKLYINIICLLTSTPKYYYY